MHLSKGPTWALLATEVKRARAIAKSLAAFARSKSWAGRDLQLYILYIYIHVPMKYIYANIC